MPINSALAQDVYKDVGENVLFLTLQLNRKDQEAEKDAVAAAVGRLAPILHSLQIRCPQAELKAAFGFSSQGWDYLFGDAWKPKELEDFTGMEAELPVPDAKDEFPGTPADLFLHIRANQQAVLFELVDQLRNFLDPAVSVVDETKGFRYFEGRAIIGFIDGTEAPGDADCVDYALIGEEDADFCNGSYAFAQKWVHDMAFWKGLRVEEQEKAVGREKFSDLELEDEDKYENAHNVAAKVEIDGEEQKIIRMNVPFADMATGQTGTYFIGYSRHWEITKAMLRQMLDKSDYLLKFSSVITGQLFFIPSREVLDAIAEGEI